MAENQETELQGHKTGNTRKGQVSQTPKLRKEGDYKPHRDNVHVNPSNGIASKPSTNIVHETRMPESGPGPSSSTKLVSGIPKTDWPESTPTLQVQVSMLPPELPQSPSTLPELEHKPLESLAKPPESEPQQRESRPTLPESGIKPHHESPLTFHESEFERIKSPPTLPKSPPTLLESQPELIESAKIHYSENKTFSINPANPSWDNYKTHPCYSSPHSVSPNYIRRMDILHNNIVNTVDEYLTIASQTISQSVYIFFYIGGISSVQSIDNCIVYKSRSILESGEQRFPEILVKISYRNFKTQDIDIKEASTDTK